METNQEKTITQKTIKKTELGFHEKLPAILLQDVTVSDTLSQGEKIGILISGSLIVFRLESDKWKQNGQIKLCDYISHVNDEKIEKKSMFYHFFSKLSKTGGAFSLKIKRPIWCSFNEKLPDGYDKAPGYNYMTALLILFPGSSLGMNVKSFNGKVFITNIEPNSMAILSCLIGDCVVAIDDVPVTSVRDFTDRITKSLKSTRVSILTIERAIDPIAINTVRLALLAEKTTFIDHPIPQDAAQIGLEESERIQNREVPEPKKSIYRTETSLSNSKRVDIDESMNELVFTSYPFNPAFMQHAPPKPCYTTRNLDQSKRLTVESTNAPVKTSKAKSLEDVKSAKSKRSRQSTKSTRSRRSTKSQRKKTKSKNTGQ